MANIKLSKKQFEKEIGKITDELQAKIALFGTPVESVDNEDVELEIFPNRPDLLSYQGFKRAFTAWLGKKPGLKKYNLKKPAKDYKVIIDNSVNKIRPYTACAIVKGLKFNDERIKEMIDIQEKLHNTVGRKRKKLAIGIYPLEKIKLPITYKALEPDKIKFIPLETEREMSGLEILQRHPTGRDYAHLLAGKPKFPIFVDAAKNILSMPPIINSQRTGKIDEKTTGVFVECSGADFNILNKCLNIIITTLADQGGEVYQMELKYKKKVVTPDLKPDKMKVSIENVNKTLGLKLNEKQIKTAIEKMGHNYKKGQVEVPAWRTDVLHEADLIEDVAIGYGYDKLIPEIPSISTIGEEDKKVIIKRKISEILTGLGLLEVSNYHLTTKTDQIKKMGLNEKQTKFTEVEESKTDYTLLRENLAHYALKNLSENVDAEYPQKIFETGVVFSENEGGISRDKLSSTPKVSGAGGKGISSEIDNPKISETENLSIAITPGNFTELKQILQYLERMLNIKLKLGETASAPKHFVDGRVAEITLNTKSIGFLGEIHPKNLKHWKIKMPVALLEINLEEIFNQLT